MKIQPALAVACTAAALCSVVSGCASGRAGERAVFPVAGTAVTWRVGDNIDSITDVGVPLFANRTDSPVRLLSVQLVSPPAILHPLGTAAYDSRGMPFSTLSSERGSLPAECPKYFSHPKPVSTITIPPRKRAHWIITIMFTIPSAGTYHFKRARISYSVNGHKGWQYQNLNLTIIYSPPPDRRLIIDPASSFCGST